MQEHSASTSAPAPWWPSRRLAASRWKATSSAGAESADARPTCRNGWPAGRPARRCAGRGRPHAVGFPTEHPCPPVELPFADQGQQALPRGRAWCGSTWTTRSSRRVLRVGPGAPGPLRTRGAHHVGDLLDSEGDREPETRGGRCRPPDVTLARGHRPSSTWTHDTLVTLCHDGQVVAARASMPRPIRRLPHSTSTSQLRASQAFRWGLHDSRADPGTVMDDGLMTSISIPGR